jgi:hypothetical protein
MTGALSAWFALWFSLTPFGRALHLAATVLALGDLVGAALMLARGLASIASGCG